MKDGELDDACAHVDVDRSWTIDVPAAHTINIGASVSADVRAVGLHPVEWNGLDDAGRPVAAGVYILRVRTAGRRHQAVLVKSR